MSEISKIFERKVNLLDKLLVFLVIPLPFYLATSIFIADFFGSIAGLIMIYIILKKDNKKIFEQIEKEAIFFFIIYLVILVNLIFSNFKEQTFLSSFFYFRYFLVSLTVFYLFKKYQNLHKGFIYIIFGSFAIVLIDSYIQKLIGINLMGYKITENYGTIFLTSFFNEEKKLGSYLIRFLPLILGLVYFSNLNKFKYFNLLFIIISGFIIFNSSERVALFLFFIFLFFFILTHKNKIIISSVLIFFLLFLFNTHQGLKYKFIDVTLMQIELLKYPNEKDQEKKKLLRYFSKEHEDLSFTAFQLFKKNIFLSNGPKSFYHACEDLKKEKIVFKNSRDNKIVCSTHPHNTYLQILSELGLVGFILFTFFFIYLLKDKKNLIFKKKLTNKNYLCFYFINLSLIISLFPLIPSGNIFNNWISLMIYYPLGYWLYIRNIIQLK